MDVKGFKKGITYSAIGNYSNLIIQLIVNMILARILTPLDFGIVSIVQIFQEFFSMLANMGIGPAIVQNKNLTKKDINVLYKFSYVLAIVLALIFAFLGYPASLFYDNSIYVSVFQVLSISVFFSSIIVVPHATLQREKNFKKINSIIIISGIIKGIIAVCLASLQFGIYSILFGGLAQVVLTYIFYMRNSGLSLKENFSLNPLKKISHFASSQFAFNFVNYFSRNLDSLLIGRYFGSVSLAFYNKSYLLTRYPTNIFTGVITPVLQPLLSDYQNDLKVIKNSYLKLSNLLANIGVSISVFFYFNAKDLILLMYGDQWLESIPTLKIISFVIWIIMISSSTAGIFQSSNRTDLLLFSGIQSAITNIIFIAIGIFLGSIEYVSLMIVISYTINFVITNYLILYKIFKSSFYEFFIAISKPLLVGVLEIGGFLIMPKLQYNALINLLISGVIFVAIFILGIFITKQHKNLIRLIRS